MTRKKVGVFFFLDMESRENNKKGKGRCEAKAVFYFLGF